MGNKNKIQKTPMRNLMKSPERGDFIWERIQFVFDLPSPDELEINKVNFSAGEEEVLIRFIKQAEILAESSLPAEDNGFTVNVKNSDGKQIESVEKTFSGDDIISGFLVRFRQIFSHKDEASYSKSSKIIRENFDKINDDDNTLINREWNKAHKKLLNNSLEYLVNKKLIPEFEPPLGIKINSSKDPLETYYDKPEIMLTKYMYSDGIHWGNHKALLNLFEKDPFFQAQWTLQTLQAACDLSIFYMGYALLIKRVLTSSLD